MKSQQNQGGPWLWHVYGNGIYGLYMDSCMIYFYFYTYTFICICTGWVGVSILCGCS